MVVFTVALDPELHRRLALAALDERASMNEIVRDALRTWLDRREGPGSRKSSASRGKA